MSTLLPSSSPIQKSAFSSRAASEAESLEASSQAGRSLEAPSSSWRCPVCDGCDVNAARVVRPCCGERVCVSCDRSIADAPRRPRGGGGRQAGYLFFADDDDDASPPPPPPRCPRCGRSALRARDVLRSLEALGERGCAAALYELGALAEVGQRHIGVAATPAAAAAYYGRAAALGDVDAMSAMGRLYLSGRGVDVDAAAAAACFSMAAERDDARGLYNLGVCDDPRGKNSRRGVS